MAMKYNRISADGHIECPPTAWVERMPKNLREFAPKVVRLPDGGDGVQIGNHEPAPLGLQLTGGQKYTEYVTRGLRFEDNPPGTGDPAQRIKEMDQDGVDAEVLYTAVVGTALTKIKDPVVLKEIARAYNSWVSEYCSYNKDRLLGCAVIPPTNTQDAIEELERAAKLPAMRMLQLLTFPNGGSWGTVGDEPFWARANELGWTVTGHHNFGGEDKAKSHPLPGQQGDKPLQMEGAVDLSMFAWLLTCDLPIPTLPILTIEQLFLGGVLDRNPKLRFLFAESGIGWVPYWMEQIDDRFERHRHWAKVKLPKKPTDYIREHIYFAFQEDHAGVALRHSIGINNICWASDFPHSVGDWPFSRETCERNFKGIPESDRRRMEALNGAFISGLITKEERERQANEQRSSVPLLKVPDRGARRSA